MLPFYSPANSAPSLAIAILDPAAIRPHATQATAEVAISKWFLISSLLLPTCSVTNKTRRQFDNEPRKGKEEVGIMELTFESHRR
jgi:hypothetical protein